jgi:hypothetical protein
VPSTMRMPAGTAEASASRLFAIAILTGIHPSGVTEEPFGEFSRYSVFHTAREELGSTIAQIYAGYVGLIRRLNETSNKVALQTEKDVKQERLSRRAQIRFLVLACP